MFEIILLTYFMDATTALTSYESSWRLLNLSHQNTSFRRLIFGVTPINQLCNALVITYK